MGWVATTKGIDEGLVGDLMMQAVEKHDSDQTANRQNDGVVAR
jgi:hypothetical protein